MADIFAKTGPPWGTDFDKRGLFWQPKSVRPDQFWQQKWSGGPVLASFSAKIRPAGPILGGTDFGVTAQILMGENIDELGLGKF